MSIALLELAAAELSDLCDEVVFVGGATIELWISDPAAAPVRPTIDVDVVVVVPSRGGFYAFQDKLRDRGFNEDSESRVICRWRSPRGLTIDVMPARAEILGFANRWQEAAIPYAVERPLPSGATIRAASPPFLLATKLAAFAGRGRGDLLGSKDFLDVVSLLDGRPELVDEVLAAEAEVRRYLAATFRGLLRLPRLANGSQALCSPMTQVNNALSKSSCRRCAAWQWPTTSRANSNGYSDFFSERTFGFVQVC